MHNFWISKYLVELSWKLSANTHPRNHKSKYVRKHVSNLSQGTFENIIERVLLIEGTSKLTLFAKDSQHQSSHSPSNWSNNLFSSSISSFSLSGCRYVPPPHLELPPHSARPPPPQLPHPPVAGEPRADKRREKALELFGTVEGEDEGCDVW